MNRTLLPCLLLALSAAACGCYHPPSGRYGAPGRHDEPLHKTIVAVTDFENRSGFSGKWNLGGGMADLMTTHLIESERFTVLERRYIQNIVGEIENQRRGLFRKEGQVERGRLKNARYLIRGVVTDFTVTGDVSGWFGTKDSAGKARGSRARVALTVSVSDVETGEIISSVQSSGKANAWGVGGGTTYQGMHFGGDAFFRSPLGKATDSAMRRAMYKLLKDIPEHPWEPRVAEAEGMRIVINGGENVGIRNGSRFVILGPSREITDPVTGDVIETIAGKAVGLVQVISVSERSAHATLLDGRAARGDLLRPE